MACGADASYIHEENFNIKDLVDCLYRMAEKFSTKQITRGLVLRYLRNLLNLSITKYIRHLNLNIKFIILHI